MSATVLHTPGWAHVIAQAQEHTHEGIGGARFERIRYAHDQQHMCGDCGVAPGQYHVPACSVERCPSCGRQAISCSCEVDAP
jgi:hypothetical protein